MTVVYDKQTLFDLSIGKLDRILSELMEYARMIPTHPDFMDKCNRQTLKHHAEDMIAAGNAIMEKLKTGHIQPIKVEKECPDSPTGKHKFEPDFEYDSTGRTVNCCYCGELAPKKPKKKRKKK